MKKALTMLLVTAVTVGLLAGCGSGGSSSMGGEDVIKVNDVTLTKNYVDARIDQVFKQNQLNSEDAFSGYYKSQIINGLVETELMIQEAKNRGIEVTDSDKEAFKKKLIEQNYGSQENFNAYLTEYNIDDAMLDRMMSDKLYYDKLVEDIKSGVKTDAEAYYNENMDSYFVGDQIRASHILVADEKTAKDLIKKLDEGEDFAELAKANSSDGSAPNGGDLGYFTAETMVPEFSEAAFALEVGEYTKTPVKSPYGYHIILCVDKKPGHQQTFDEVKDEINETLTNQEVQTQYYTVVSALREKATIEYLVDAYNPEKLIAEAEAKMAEGSTAGSAN